MSDLTVSKTLVADPPAFTDQQIFLNLLRQEWRLCRGAVTALAMLWVIGLWVLVIFNHPGWLLAIGLLHLLIVTPSQAGRDVLDGTEEFSFTQPPGRGPLYLARLSLGLGFLLVNGVLGGLAIAGDLPQRLWSLCFSGGLTEPFGTTPGFLWYGLAVLVPTAAHGITFVFAANAGSRAGVNIAWLGGIIVAGITAVGLVGLENLLWPNQTGILAFAALLFISVLVPLAGYFSYLRKEATGSGGGAGSLGGGGMLWLTGLIFGLLLLLLLGFFWMRTSVIHSTPEPPRPLRSAPVPPVLPSPPTPERNSN